MRMPRFDLFLFGTNAYSEERTWIVGIIYTRKIRVRLHTLLRQKNVYETMSNDVSCLSA